MTSQALHGLILLASPPNPWWTQRSLGEAVKVWGVALSNRCGSER